MIGIMAGVKRSLAEMMAQDSVATGVGIPPLASPFASPDESNSSRAATPPFTSLRGEIPNFGSDASIAIVGLRGSGKSTLAVMASSAFKRKIINMETAFQRFTGTPISIFRQINGTLECQERQVEVLEDVLRQNPTGSIIVCYWMERRVQTLLRQFAATNPVVHIIRSIDAIQSYLKLGDKRKAQNLFNMSNLFYGTCTNLEFFNITEKSTTSAQLSQIHGTAPGLQAPYLTLKQAETHFLKFLSLIFPPGTIPFFESAFPLASIPPESRQYTYALSLDMTDILGGTTEWQDSIVGVDAVQIYVGSLAAKTVTTGDADIFCAIAMDISQAVAITRRSTMLPILLHIKLPETVNGSLVRLYLDLVGHAIALAPEMLTVDLRLDSSDISKIISAKKRSKIIGNYFTSASKPSWDSSIWISWYNKARHSGCDMARLVRLGTCMEDNFEISKLRCKINELEGEKIPLISYNSGPLGRHSACLNKILTLTAPKPAAQLPKERHPLPYITAKEATKALYASFVYDPLKLYVFGKNVGYSVSPAMHNVALAACGIPHRYEPYSSDSLDGIRHLINDSNFGGASIGLPFKVEVISLTQMLSPHAKAVGAVNTIIPLRNLNDDGSISHGPSLFRYVNRAGPVLALYGENTDWIGIKACIRRGLSPANAVRSTTMGLVIGAGGMARAAVYAMLQVGVKNIAIYNRTTTNAEKLVSHFQQLLTNKDFELLSNDGDTKFHIFSSLTESWPLQSRLPSIIVSCIPNHPVENIPSPEFKLPESWLGNPTGGVIFELGYKTLDTPLLTQARDGASRGWVAMSGLDLLPEQGFAQFELFTGRRAPHRIMRQEVVENFVNQAGESHLQDLQERLQFVIKQGQ